MEEELKRTFILGKEAFNNNEFVKAEKNFKAIIKKNKNYADVYNMLGLIYHEQGQFSKAQESFEKALELNPNYTDASLNLAVTYNDLGMYKEAKNIYHRAKKASEADAGELDPFVKGKLANMHSALGDAYREASLYDEAIGEYKKALMLRPKFIDIKTKLADGYREKGDLEKSVKEYIDAKKISKNYAPISVNLGIAYYTMGMLHKAKTEWESILSYDQNNKLARMYLRLTEEAPKESDSLKKTPAKKKK